MRSLEGAFLNWNSLRRTAVMQSHFKCALRSPCTSLWDTANVMRTQMAPSARNEHSCTNTTPNPLATEELNLLAKLMGGMEMEKILNVDAGFKVNLLALDQEEEGIGISEETDQLASTELARIAGEFDEGGSLTEGPGNKGDDLLAMMDEL
uniref:Uncharacterized protein n=1 Tax=Sinocyclocheilus anshuiensis TaxID=1608454 RepID=A0A671M3H1_9TELE